MCDIIIESIIINFLLIVQRLIGRCVLRRNGSFFSVFNFICRPSFCTSSGKNGLPCKRRQIVHTSFLASENLIFGLFSEQQLPMIFIGIQIQIASKGD